jgi:Domain of unknown function (DUF1918)
MSTDGEREARRFDGIKGGEQMPTKPVLTSARAGDLIECRGVHGRGPRRGTITEVLGGEGHEHYRVRWDEKHESIVYPADGVMITPVRRRQARGTARS